MKKLYYAFVTEEMNNYFEEKLDERKDDIKVVHTNRDVSENGEALIHYILEAEEGVINSEWKLD